MANRPKDVEAKMEQMLTAWETLAVGKSFGGMTLQQFKAVCAPSKQARLDIEALNDQLTAALARRDSGDTAFLPLARQVVNGVLADPTEGANSPLYEAMGYTRESERKSGLTRKKKTPPKG